MKQVIYQCCAVPQTCLLASTHLYKRACPSMRPSVIVRTDLVLCEDLAEGNRPSISNNPFFSAFSEDLAEGNTPSISVKVKDHEYVTDVEGK